MAKRTKSVRWTITVGWQQRVSVSGGSNNIAGKLIHLDPAITARIRSVTATYGIIDDPTDERLSFWIQQIDPDDIDQVLFEESMRLAVWSKEETWRSIGTDAGPTQVMENDSSDVVDRTYSQKGGDDPSVICAMMGSSTTSFMAFYGHAIFDIVYTQTTYNNSQNPNEELEQWILN